MRVAFDIDDTLWKIVHDKAPRVGGIGAICACGIPVKQETDQHMMDMAHALITNGDTVILWSAGGVEYVKNWVRKYAPAWESLVEILPKEAGHKVDITIDDQEIDLGEVNLRIQREHSDHWQAT